MHLNEAFYLPLFVTLELWWYEEPMTANVILVSLASCHMIMPPI